MNILYHDNYGERHTDLVKLLIHHNTLPRGTHNIVHVVNQAGAEEALDHYEFDLVSLDTYNGGPSICRYIARMDPKDRPPRVNIHSWVVDVSQSMAKTLLGLTQRPLVTNFTANNPAFVDLVAAIFEEEEKRNAEEETCNIDAIEAR